MTGKSRQTWPHSHFSHWAFFFLFVTKLVNFYYWNSRWGVTALTCKLVSVEDWVYFGLIFYYIFGRRKKNTNFNPFTDDLIISFCLQLRLVSWLYLVIMFITVNFCLVNFPEAIDRLMRYYAKGENVFFVFFLFQVYENELKVVDIFN